MGRKRTPVADRLMARREVDDETGCWNWLGCKGTSGYGQIRMPDGPATRDTHRVAYETFVGPVPDGLKLDHLCRNRACFNPDHLEPVTNRENILRGTGYSAVNARKTHCKHGHPFVPENMYISRDGARICKTCHSRYMRDYKARRRGLENREQRAA